MPGIDSTEATVVVSPSSSVGLVVSGAGAGGSVVGSGGAGVGAGVGVLVEVGVLLPLLVGAVYVTLRLPPWRASGAVVGAGVGAGVGSAVGSCGAGEVVALGKSLAT